MRRITKKEEAASLARMEAEDRAVAYLTDEKWAPEVSMAIARRVEFFLALVWEDEQEDMRRQDSPKLVFEISVCQMQEARRAFVKTVPGLSDAGAEQHVIDMLTKFPADKAWWLARKVRDAVVHWQEARISRASAPPTPPLEPGELPPFIKSLIESQSRFK